MSDSQRGPRWMLSATIVATLVVLAAAFALPGQAVTLRDRHATPVYTVTLPVVAVAREGKLFHDPRCPVIHGPTLLEPMAAAVDQHFVPCPRCLGALRAAPRAAP